MTFRLSNNCDSMVPYESLYGSVAFVERLAGRFVEVVVTEDDGLIRFKTQDLIFARSLFEANVCDVGDFDQWLDETGTLVDSFWQSCLCRWSFYYVFQEDGRTFEIHPDTWRPLDGPGQWTEEQQLQYEEDMRSFPSSWDDVCFISSLLSWQEVGF